MWFLLTGIYIKEKERRGYLRSYEWLCFEVGYAPFRTREYTTRGESGWQKLGRGRGLGRRSKRDIQKRGVV